MKVGFGYVDVYRDRKSWGSTGFGFLTCYFGVGECESDKFYFHIKTIKKKYPDLAIDMDSGNWHGVKLWYITEQTEKGCAVVEVWLHGFELPVDLHNSAVEEVEKQWRDVRDYVPSRLKDITIDLVGEEGYNRLAAPLQAILEKRRLNAERIAREAEERRQQEQAEIELKRRQEAERRAREIDEQRRREQAALELKRCQEVERQAREAEQRRIQAEAQRKLDAEHIEAQRQQELAQQEEARQRAQNIQAFCRVHEIDTLVHFTRIENLAGILANGMQGRNDLEQAWRLKSVVFNDDKRIDGHQNAVCLCISFPNFKMFYRLRQTNHGGWVVLVLNPNVLWELDCAFCHENAASNNVRYISLQERKKFQALERMYSDHHLNPRKNLAIPINYPTHPQAEVLVFQPIPVHYIREVHFSNIAQLQDWHARHTHVPRELLVVNGQYFNARRDYAAWQTPAIPGEYDSFFVEDFPFFGPPEDYVPFDDDIPFSFPEDTEW